MWLTTCGVTARCMHACQSMQQTECAVPLERRWHSGKSIPSRRASSCTNRELLPPRQTASVMQLPLPSSSQLAQLVCSSTRSSKVSMRVACSRQLPHCQVRAWQMTPLPARLKEGTKLSRGNEEAGGGSSACYPKPANPQSSTAASSSSRSRCVQLAKSQRTGFPAIKQVRYGCIVCFRSAPAT